MVQEKDELIKKRVLYIGSAVPIDTAEGLDAVQKPLADRYPVDDDDKIEGILSFLSITRSGIRLQYVSDPGRVLFFPISSLNLCAAVRCVTSVNPTTGENTARFVSLSSPAAGGANSKRPAIFTTVTRRTEGRKVLECHGFVCSSSKDALELVQSTSFADRLSKGKINGTVPSVENGSQVDGSVSRSVATPVASAAAVAVAPVAGPDGDHPIRLVAGDSASPRVAPEFYEAAPEHGYFYMTRDSQVRTYTVERITDGETERLRAISPSAAATLPRTAQVERRSVYGGPVIPVAGAMTLPHPQGRPLIPVRPVLPPAAFARPRFFSPPPPVLRARPVPGQEPYIILPPHPEVLEPPYIVRRHPQRSGGSRSSSRGSSGSLSPESPRQTGGQQGVNGDAADGSSDSSRPRSPPTDYESGPRVSRKERFDRHRRFVNGVPAHYSTLPAGPVPYEMLVYPPAYPYPGYPPYIMERARSVPPPANRGKSKDRKKSRKSKKDKKSGKQRVHEVPSDVSAESLGYTSEMGPAGDQPRLPRDFRRFENQFKHERAFSKSLAEESRNGAAENTGKAYSLNEHMSQKAPNDFNLY